MNVFEIPYRSQWDADANSRTADCGAACCAMLVEWCGMYVPINSFPHQSQPNGLTTAAHLVANLEDMGLPAEIRMLPTGAPTPPGSICLNWYGGFDRDSVQDKSYTGWHWMILLQEGASEVVTHDPNWWGSHRNEGAEKRYSREEWEAAFKPYPGDTQRTVVLLSEGAPKMKSRIGYNIHAQFVQNTPLLMNHLRAVQPVSVLVMDGLGLANEIKAALPDCIVISRIYPDEDIHNRKSPTDWMNERAPQAANGIWQYTTNEAGFSPNLIQWHIELCHLAIQRNVPLVIGNMSVGTPAPEDWAAGRELFELMNSRRDLFILGLHEYACGVITSGFLGGYPDNAGVPPGEIGGVNLIPSANWPDPTPKPMYHCGRVQFLIDYCTSVGIQTPRIILTEHGFDDVSDIKPWSQTLIQTPPYTSIRGWRSIENQWKAWYQGISGWTPQRAMFEQVKYADQTIYKGSPVEAQLLFCWARPDNSNWEQFDLSDASEFQDLLAAYDSGTSEPPDTGDGGTEPPMPTTEIDVLPYFRGDGRIIDVNQYGNITGFETFYIQPMPQDSRFWRQVKITLYESFAVWSEAGGEFIMRDLDTSPGPNECYRLRDKDLSGWSRWCPRRMKIGQRYTRRPLVSFLNKTTGQPVPGKPTYEDVTDIVLVKHHAVWTAPHTGVIVHDVIELAGYPHGSDQIGETWFFGRGYGYVGWKDNRSGGSSIIYDPSRTHPTPVPEQLGAWANPPALPADVPVTQPPQPQPPTQPAKPGNAADPVTFTVSTSYKLRFEPDTSAAQIGLLKAGETIKAYRVPETDNDGNLWHFMERVTTPAGEAAQGYSAVPLPAPVPPDPEPPTDPKTFTMQATFEVPAGTDVAALQAALGSILKIVFIESAKESDDGS